MSTTLREKAPALESYVGGAWRRSESDVWIDDINPSDASDIVARIPRGTADDVRAAVAAASDAGARWRALTGPARAEYLHKWGAAIADRQEELAQVVTREVGKPIAEARGEAARCVAILRYYAGESVREVGESFRRKCRARCNSHCVSHSGSSR